MNFQSKEHENWSFYLDSEIHFLSSQHCKHTGTIHEYSYTGRWYCNQSSSDHGWYYHAVDCTRQYQSMKPQSLCVPGCMNTRTNPRSWHKKRSDDTPTCWDIRRRHRTSDRCQRNRPSKRRQRNRSCFDKKRCCDKEREDIHWYPSMFDHPRNTLGCTHIQSLRLYCCTLLQNCTHYWSTCQVNCKFLKFHTRRCPGMSVHRRKNRCHTSMCSCRRCCNMLHYHGNRDCFPSIRRYQSSWSHRHGSLVCKHSRTNRSCCYSNRLYCSCVLPWDIHLHLEWSSGVWWWCT